MCEGRFVCHAVFLGEAFAELGLFPPQGQLVAHLGIAARQVEFEESERDPLTVNRRQRGVTQLASSWVRTREATEVRPMKSPALNFIVRRFEVSWACGPRLEASQATPSDQ